jgi:hypothetical protein
MTEMAESEFLLPNHMRVPDQVGETRKAWRAWKISIENGEICLRSINQKDGGDDSSSTFKWKPREVMTAVHVSGSSQERKDDHSDDDVPYEGCSCGIHALDTGLFLAKLGYVSFVGPGRSNYVWGEIEMWGKIIEGTTGVKGQFAYPHRFYLRPDLEFSVEGEGGITKLNAWLLRDILSQQWGVPVVIVKTMKRVSLDSNDVIITETTEPNE